MPKITGLGKGLGSLIPPKIDKQILPQNSSVFVQSEMIVKVPINKIKANPHQPRTDFDHESLEDLTNSIKEHGIIQPLILTPSGNDYEVIAGERRLRAAQILELETVPAVIRDIQEQQKLELALVENIQRKDLNAIEEAVAYQRLIDEFNLTQEEAAVRVGKSRSAVTNALRLLGLPTEIQKALVTGKINYTTARVIVGLPPQERLKFFEKIIKQDLTVRAVENQAKKVIVRQHIRKAKDPNLTALEDKLQSALGTKVIVKKTGETGYITIEFYSSEDLEGIVNKICQ
ncbi:MAG: ParB/RepB/Spo0J family partition protein [Candidatus Buchananbacteria bacterium]